jgi:superfamily II DNA or RNA helicase
LDRDLDDAIEKLQATPDNNPRLRPYQRESDNAVEKAMAGRKRVMLVAAATAAVSGVTSGMIALTPAPSARRG